MSIEERIIVEAGELFFRHGIRTITMDDIANKLGISKKTIYQYYKDKNLLVQSLTDRILQEQQDLMNEIRRRTDDPILEILHHLEHFSEFISKINPNMFFDLQKYHPHAWHSFKKFKEQCVIGMVEGNLERGIENGLYRPELNVKILSRLRVEQVDWAFTNKIYDGNKFTITEVQLALLDHFLHGIVSLKGFNLIEKHKSQLSKSYPKI